MALGPRLELKQTQRLTMTPQLRQAISLLQMSNLELSEHLAEEVEKNPLLELEETAKEEAPIERRTEVAPSERATGGAFEDFDQLNNIENRQSLRDYLREQIHLAVKDIHRTGLALALIDELDERGYIATPMFEITDRLGVSQADIEDSLLLLQDCEPAGIGARNLPECLILQLRESGDLDDTMQVLVANLDQIAAGDLVKLGKLTGLNKGALATAIERLQQLNPKPAAGFEYDVIQTAAPDILVNKTAEGGWAVELVTDSLPRVLVNEVYASEISKDGAEVTEFLTECRANARFLVKAMDQRAKTILRVATVIVRRQNLFFDKGINGLRPLTLADIAGELEVHESTVSRVTSGKFLYCPRGSFELRFFFAQGIHRTDGGADIAAPVVREKIRKLIASETADSVLSDEKITNFLQEDGVDVARRTVAKYRESMGIPSSSRRKKQWL